MVICDTALHARLCPDYAPPERRRQSSLLEKWSSLSFIRCVFFLSSVLALQIRLTAPVPLQTPSPPSGCSRISVLCRSSSSSSSSVENISTNSIETNSISSSRIIASLLPPAVAAATSVQGRSWSPRASRPHVRPLKSSGFPLAEFPHNSIGETEDSLPSEEGFGRASAFMEKDLVPESSSPSAGAAGPSPSRSRPRRSSPRWAHPCEKDYKDDPSITVADMTTYIFRQVKTAILSLNEFKTKFTREIYNRTWEEQLEEIKDYNLTFIREVPKVDSREEHFGSVDFDSFLKDSYILLQERAVGIEQSTLDHCLYTSNFLPGFQDIEERIVYILCEMHVAMMHRKVVPPNDITREIMCQEYRDIESAPFRYKRDMAILREYDHLLSYMEEGLRFYNQRGS